MSTEPPHESSEELRVPYQEWLHGVVERFEGPLVAYAARMLSGDWHLARDCVQDTFLRLCREPRDLIENHIEAWLFRCCRHRTIDLQRKESRMPLLSPLDQEEPADRTNNDPAAPLVACEDRESVRRVISSLPEREQEVLFLRVQQGLSYKQIADVMDMSSSHVGVLLHQAVMRLRGSLSQTCDT